MNEKIRMADFQFQIFQNVKQNQQFLDFFKT